jgi:hypothetical protein
MPYQFPAVDPGVYFLKSTSTGLIKIGQSRDVGMRIHWTCKASAETLQLIATLPTDEPRQAERILHRFFKEKQVRGEWFRISETEVRSAVANWEQLKSMELS